MCTYYIRQRTSTAESTEKGLNNGITTFKAGESFNRAAKTFRRCLNHSKEDSQRLLG